VPADVSYYVIFCSFCAVLYFEWSPTQTFVTALRKGLSFVHSFIHSLFIGAVSDLDYVTLNDRMTEFFCLRLDLCVPSHCGLEVIDALDHTQTHHTRQNSSGRVIGPS
jgi:hypothetical protein